MQRKIIQQSASSLGISLPSKWARQWQLKKGEALDVHEKGHQLVVSAKGSADVRRVELDVRLLGNITKRLFDAIYKKGYDEVVVLYDTQEQLAPILEAVGDEAKSFEVVGNSNGRCVIRSISELDQEEFEDLLRRTVHLLRDMAADIVAALERNDVPALRAAVRLEQTNNRFTHVLRRSLNRLEYADQGNAMLLYTITESLEKAADEMKYLCKEAKASVQPATLALAQRVTPLLEQFTLLFAQFSVARAVAFAATCKAFEADGVALLEKGKDALVLHRLLALASIVYDLLGPMMALRY